LVIAQRIGAEPFVVRTRSVIVLSRLVNRPDVIPPPGLAGDGPARSRHV